MNATMMQLKGPALVVGFGALAVLGALAFSTHTSGAADTTDLAGSGDAPANTVYVEPTVAPMNLGATATMQTPPSSLPTSVAVPAVRAGG